jgi:diphthamide biosynthesis methyltransferase
LDVLNVISRNRLLKELVFVGLGLHDEKGISLKGVEETKSADAVFMELYTNLLSDFSIKRFEAIIGKKIHLLQRRNLEEENGALLLNAAEKGKTVFLVPGDPLIATTHVTLRIEAEKHGVKTSIVHGASIISAIIGLSGLHNYKIAQNKKLGLHTLCLLDLKIDEKRFLTINKALTLLLEIEQKRNEGIITPNTIAVGIARAGSDTPNVKADHIKNLTKHDFGNPPQSLIFPSELHFMETEALITLASAPETLRRKPN